MTQPLLKPLHSERSLSLTKLDKFRKVETAELVASLKPGEPGSLKVRPDGTIMDGYHRVEVLRERGVDVGALAREVVPKDGPEESPR